MVEVRKFLKRVLPLPARTVLRGVSHYVQRVARWAAILWQVRGRSWSDKWVLWRSALAAPVVSLRDLMEWQDPILLAPADVRVPGVGNFRLRPRCDDLYHVWPSRESAIIAAIKGLLRESDVFIDAGANIGVYTVMASRLVGPRGKVIAVEMIPDTADRLDEHIRINGLENVTVIRSALSDSSGKTLTATVEAGKYGQARIANSGPLGKGVKSIEVGTVTLDGISENLGQCRLMKMDLEGAELAALTGGASMLKRTQHVIYESWGMRRVERESVDKLLQDAHFFLKRIDGNNWIASRTA